MGSSSRELTQRRLSGVSFQSPDSDRMRQGNHEYALQDLGDGRGYRTGIPPRFVHANGLGQGARATVLFNHEGILVLDYNNE